MQRISVVGLGKLGLSLAVTAASRGFLVKGYDISEKVVKGVSKGVSHIYENKVEELLNKYKRRIEVSTETTNAARDSNITFVVTTTPSKRNGDFSIKLVRDAVTKVARGLRHKKTYHLIVLVSTILPGSCKKIIHAVEKVSGKKCSRDFGFCYNPEFIALGTVVKNLLNPDFILIGESDQKAGDILEDFYHCNQSDYKCQFPPYFYQNHL